MNERTSRELFNLYLKCQYLLLIMGQLTRSFALLLSCGRSSSWLASCVGHVSSRPSRLFISFSNNNKPQKKTSQQAESIYHEVGEKEEQIFFFFFVLKWDRIDLDSRRGVHCLSQRASERCHVESRPSKWRHLKLELAALMKCYSKPQMESSGDLFCHLSTTVIGLQIRW